MFGGRMSAEGAAQAAVPHLRRWFLHDPNPGLTPRTIYCRPFGPPLAICLLQSSRDGIAAAFHRRRACFIRSDRSEYAARVGAQAGDPMIIAEIKA